MRELNEAQLAELFGREPEKFYANEMFRTEGFLRRKCPSCGRYFWSITKEVCGDAACEEYGFIGKPQQGDYVSTWKVFEKFFVARGHASIHRYPVVSRWYDLYFTNASIVDFMRKEGGVVTFEYPANPLIVPQFCLRFVDIQSVGQTGRHLTGFVMPGQHAFGWPTEPGGYFRDECMSLSFEFLTKEMRIPKEELCYIEDVWAMPDFSAFGPSFEGACRGLELVTHVFMQFRASNSGFVELPTLVNDTGWGLERLAWWAVGSPTIYDATFGPVAREFLARAGVKYDSEFVRWARACGGAVRGEALFAKLGLDEEHAEDVRRAVAVYAFLDHARTLLFAIADGAVPSNVGGGYNLRVILRRALTAARRHAFEFGLIDVAEAHARALKDMFPELRDAIPAFAEVIHVEEKRYRESLARAKAIVLSEVRAGIDLERALVLYESHGITPEFAKEVAHEAGLAFEIPEGFYARLTERHQWAKLAEEGVAISLPQLPPTRTTCYTSLEETARVLHVGRNFVVLDTSPFYPEGGGQEADHGRLEANGKVWAVRDVQKVGTVVVHFVDTPEGLTEGLKVRAIVDAQRRAQIAAHHTATHIINAAARAVLGRHVWQAGAHKAQDSAHLDITHFARCTKDELREIERVANEIVTRDIPVTIKELPRGVAEAKYGFGIYQGGAPPGKVIRIVGIEGVDYEACGGIHCTRTGEVGTIKITREERIQDGVNRLEFAAGNAALRWISKTIELAEQSAKILGTQKERLPESVEKIFTDWKRASKVIDRLVDLYVAEIPPSDEIEKFLALPADVLKKLAAKLSARVPHALIVVYNHENFVVVATKSPRYDAAAIVQRFVERFGGEGGGSKTIAFAKCTRKLKP